VDRIATVEASRLLRNRSRFAAPAETRHIQRVLRIAKGNRACRPNSGIDRRTLYRKKYEAFKTVAKCRILQITHDTSR